jgi:lysyl-tRNA synthetase class II
MDLEIETRREECIYLKQLKLEQMKDTYAINRNFRRGKDRQINHRTKIPGIQVVLLQAKKADVQRASN